MTFRVLARRFCGGPKKIDVAEHLAKARKQAAAEHMPLFGFQALTLRSPALYAALAATIAIALAAEYSNPPEPEDEKKRKQ